MEPDNWSLSNPFPNKKNKQQQMVNIFGWVKLRGDISPNREENPDPSIYP